MSNRVVNRRGARELTAEEIERIAGATGTGHCLVTGTREIPDQTCQDTDHPI